MAEPLPRSEVADGAALQLFQQQWAVYQAFLEHDYLSNAGACAALGRFLRDELARPFRFLDLACGDASGVAKALAGTRVEHYRGVDLSAPALAYARQALDKLDCPVELVEADFSAILDLMPRREDVVWLSLSLHHLDSEGKLALMRRVRDAIGSDGAFLIYEPARWDGEDRPAYLDRFEDVGRRQWSALGETVFAEGMKHVRGCDLPETVSGWHALGREAGFASVRELFRAPTDLFRLFLYRP